MGAGQLRQWRDKAGLTPESLGYDLRLQDARGTAATALLNSGLTLSQLAAFFGWSPRFAASVIENYARVSPDQSDAILLTMTRTRGGES